MTAIELPARPARDGSSTPGSAEPNAQARARARARLPRPQAVVSWVATGSSPLVHRPDHMLGHWDLHTKSARFYRHATARWPRYAWGAVHAFTIAPLCYGLVWATDSPPKALAALAVAVAVLRLLGVHIIWSWL